MLTIIAGGGTGGHLFPGIALAQELTSRNPDNRVIFAGTKKGIEQRLIPPMGYELKTISGAGIVGGTLVQRVRGFFQFLIGFFQALWIIGSRRPDLVIGTGGYASVSVILAAYLFRVETAICEQNSIPGLTNRVLGRFVKKVFIAFEESSPFFPRKKIFLSGNPLRKEFLCQSSRAPEKEDKFILLILGGSQGAHSINQGMIECLEVMAPLKNTLKIIHQTGLQDFPWVQEAYEKKGFKADVVPFITEMASVYRRADLVVSRAGAITITEILVCGKPSLLIPYPYAAYNHQEMNARILAEKGAARMIPDKDLKGNLGAMILHLASHPEELEAMGGKAKAMARPDASRVIVDHYFPGGRS